jgi:transposase-like protein
VREARSQRGRTAGEGLESDVAKTRDKAAAFSVIKKALKRQGSQRKMTTDGLKSYHTAMKEIGNAHKQEAMNAARLTYPFSRSPPTQAYLMLR